MNNLGLKLFSLGIAIVLFSFITNESNSSVLTREVPVEFTSIPAGTMVIAPLDPQVEVSIKGPSSLVSRIATTPPVFKVKIPENAEHRFTASLTKEDLGLPPYFSVLKIEPAQIEVTIDSLVSKEVPVSVPRIGSIGEGLSIESLSIVPEQVRLTGPATELSAVSSVETYPLDLRDVDHSVTRQLAIKPPGKFTEVSPRQSSVSLQVGFVEGEQSFSQLPIEVRAMPGQNYSVDPATVDVVLKGPLQAVQRIGKEDVVPFVRVRDATDGGPLMVTIEHLPPAIHADITPAQVRVAPASTPVPEDAEGAAGRRGKRGNRK
jgi:YbbR domain-containing protein